jgi:hypothetical protein
VLSKRRRLGRRMKRVTDWPVTAAGWSDAWDYLLIHHRKLAKGVAQVAMANADRCASAEDLASHRAELAAHGRLDALRGCVLLGGYGYKPGIRPGDRVDLLFTDDGVWLAKSGHGPTPYLRRSYQASVALDLGDRAVGTGGQLGRAEGAVMAALLDELTARARVHSTIRYEAIGAELFLFTKQADEGALESRLAKIQTRINGSLADCQPAMGPGAPDLSDRLVRLGEMLDRGQLSPREFNSAKAHLLSSFS